MTFMKTFNLEATFRTCRNTKKNHIQGSKKSLAVLCAVELCRVSTRRRNIEESYKKLAINGSCLSAMIRYVWVVERNSNQGIEVNFNSTDHLNGKCPKWKFCVFLLSTSLFKVSRRPPPLLNTRLCSLCVLIVCNCVFCVCDCSVCSLNRVLCFPKHWKTPMILPRDHETKQNSTLMDRKSFSTKYQSYTPLKQKLLLRFTTESKVPSRR